MIFPWCRKCGYRSIAEPKEFDPRNSGKVEEIFYCTGKLPHTVDLVITLSAEDYEEFKRSSAGIHTMLFLKRLRKDNELKYDRRKKYEIREKE